LDALLLQLHLPLLHLLQHLLWSFYAVLLLRGLGLLSFGRLLIGVIVIRIAIVVGCFRLRLRLRSRFWLGLTCGRVWRRR
jgi:hypothetical protein